MSSTRPHPLTGEEITSPGTAGSPDQVRSPWPMVAVGTVLMAGFMLVDWVFWTNGWLGTGVRADLTDSLLRVCFGVASLLVLKRFYADRFRDLFVRKIDRTTWILLLPVWVFLVAETARLFAAESGSLSGFFWFLPVCVQQLATGLYEEGAARGVIMCGFSGRFRDRIAGRLLIVAVSGGIFGAAHVLNCFFGGSLEESLWQALDCFAWGSFIAAIYLLCENLALVMVLHAAWDIVIRVPGFFTTMSPTSPIPSTASMIQEIVHYVFPIATILICVFYDRLRAGQEPGEAGEPGVDRPEREPDRSAECTRI